MADMNDNSTTNTPDGFSALSGASAPAPLTTSDPAVTSTIDSQSAPAFVPAQAPSAPAQPQSKWESILTGALMGMTAGAGQRFFGTGMAAGAKEVTDLNQRQTENQQNQQQIDQRQQQIDIQKQEQPYRIKFMSAQAASLAADAALRDKQLHAFDADHQQTLNERSLGLMKTLSDMGVQPTSVIDNLKGGKPAMAAMQDMTARQGGVPPMFTVVLGDKIVGYDLTQLTKSPGILDQINGVRAVTGQAAIDPQTWSQLPQQAQIAQTNSALGFWNPLPTEDNLLVYKNYLATAKEGLKANPANQGNVDRLQSIVTDMQGVLDEQQKRGIAQKNAITAGTAAADASAAGKKAYAVGYGTEKGKIDADPTSNPNGMADMFGNAIGGPGLNQKEILKRTDSYDKQYGGDLNQLSQAATQLNGIISNAEKTGRLPGAASVVGLFDAIGISSAPLKGRGFRISNEIVGEHAGARNAIQTAAIKLQKASPNGTGQVVTLQQLKDYQAILTQAVHDAYVGAANQANAQHIGIQFVPQGHNQVIDPSTANIFFTLAGQDPAKARQAAIKAGWKVQ